MNLELKNKLIQMAQRDEEVRSNLIRRGLLFGAYHPEMEQVHNDHADELERIMAEHGWPTRALVGDEASNAAWLIVQHAIGKPGFQKSCLEILKREVANGTVDAKGVAYLEDRILVFEGKPQIYGTQFDWDASSKLSPRPIRDPDKVDVLRRSVGLPPLEEVTQQIRDRARAEGDRPPADPQKREAEFLAWAKRVGWRN